MEALGYSDPDGQAHASSDWEIVKTAAATVVWQAPGVTGIDAVHIHLADGAFVGPYAGRTELEFDTDYLLHCRYRDAAGETSAWSERAFRTTSAGPPGQPGPNPWAPASGFVVDVIAGGFRLPTNIAFVPNPGPNPGDPLFYITELYGTIKVVFRNGTVGTYASGLLNFNPSVGFSPAPASRGPASAWTPATGQVYVTLLYESADEGSPHYPKCASRAADGAPHPARRRSSTWPARPRAVPPDPHLSIGPDGKLYVHNGDGFAALDLIPSAARSADESDGSAPSDNPFYDASDGIHARDYVFAMGCATRSAGSGERSDGFTTKSRTDRPSTASPRSWRVGTSARTARTRACRPSRAITGIPPTRP
jgi:hypothetical protein